MGATRHEAAEDVVLSPRESTIELRDMPLDATQGVPPHHESKASSSQKELRHHPAMRLAQQLGARVLALPDRIFLVAVVLGTYVLVSFGVGSLYPFSVFEMYALNQTNATASRILVRSEVGAVREVPEFHHWRCQKLPSFSPDECRSATQGEYYSIPYVDRERQEWVERHPAASGDVLQPVTLIRRIWRFTDANHFEFSDCVLGSCEAAP